MERGRGRKRREGEKKRGGERDVACSEIRHLWNEDLSFFLFLLLLSFYVWSVVQLRYHRETLCMCVFYLFLFFLFLPMAPISYEVGLIAAPDTFVV